MPESAQVLLKNKTPLQPIDAPSRRNPSSGITDNDDDDDDGVETADRTSISQDEYDEQSQSSSSPQQREQHRNFKEQLEQMLAKPAARVVSRTGTTQVQMHPAKPVPLPRKRVMFNDDDDEKK